MSVKLKNKKQFAIQAGGLSFKENKFETKD